MTSLLLSASHLLTGVTDRRIVAGGCQLNMKRSALYVTAGAPGGSGACTTGTIANGDGAPRLPW